MNKPNPGSQEAVDMGCTCPVLDNEYGEGAYGDGKAFWYTEGCPVHTGGRFQEKNEK